MAKRNYPYVSMKNVNILDGFFGKWQDINSKKTIYSVYERSKETGRIDAFKLKWKSGMKNKPHKFWDSDVAKWVESAAYTLYHHPDNDLKTILDKIIDLIINAQQPDGYINIFFTAVQPENRWKNLRDEHELYCAGHLIEAAVAMKEYLNDNRLLDAMIKYIDYIISVFGREDGKIPGYPGHQEIELALVKIFHVTGEQKFLELSKYFVEERGQDPFYFDIEAKERGEPTKDLSYLFKGGISLPSDYLYAQSHLPAVEQEEAFGHSVRACYFYSAMADIAMEYEDEQLMKACLSIWEDIAYKKMYITGGIGSTSKNEGWTYAYDLPNDTAYAETCAAIAWFFFNHRLSQSFLDGKYGDMMERALYNGILSGIGLEGETFFYVNPLEVDIDSFNENNSKHTYPQRQKFFNCSCCPPNISRLIGNFGDYMYNFNGDDLVVNLYSDNEFNWDDEIILKMKSNYPWESKITLSLDNISEKYKNINIFLRIPSWCQSYNVKINNKEYSNELVNGFIKMKKDWNSHDEIEIMLEMDVLKVKSNPKVKSNNGKVALQRGPIIYCLEVVDNSLKSLKNYRFHSQKPIELINTTIKGWNLKALKLKGEITQFLEKEKLYFWYWKKEDIEFVAVPYFAWANRGKAAMAVWLNEGC